MLELHFFWGDGPPPQFSTNRTSLIIFEKKNLEGKGAPNLAFFSESFDYFFENQRFSEL